MLHVFHDIQVEVWEAVVTFLLFPALVYLAYLTDKGLPWSSRTRAVGDVTENGKQIELGNIHPGECKFSAARSLSLPCTCMNA